MNFMKTNQKRMTVMLAAVVIAGLVLQAPASEIPLQLPKPDGQPGNPKKPVKVYVLAGQSNMVGMGDISGARPEHGKIYFSADLAIISGVTAVGANERGSPIDTLAVERLSVFDAKAGKTPVALGTVAAQLPALEGGKPLVVTAQIEVPVTGTYLIRAGSGASTNNVITLDGQSVTGKVALVAGKRYPITITYSASGSAAFWLEQVDIAGNGDLVTITKRDKKFTYLIDDAGKWTARNDVTYIDPRIFPERASTPLSATSNNGKSIGPELGFGSVIGTFHGEQVLIIKTAMGNRSLKFDFQPPSSGRTDPNNKYEGYEYRAMIEGVRDTLAKIDKVVPGYAGQGYEIAGFGWFQGHKDSGSPKEEYEKHLVNLINDLRKEFKAPKMKVVVTTVGFHGYQLATTPWWGIWQAQMAVGDAKQHPEFAGNVASADTRDFWREVEESPRGQDYHYNRNAETYLLVGEAMGRAMVRLEGGEAAAFPKSDREAKTAAKLAAAAAKKEPTAEQKAASRAALKPLILESALPAFISNPRNQPALKAALAAQKLPKPIPFLDDILDDVTDFYRTAGISDYDWKPFGGDLKNATWDYSGFDLPGHPNRAKFSSKAAGEMEVETEEAAPAKAKGKSPPPIQVTFPSGLENWFAPEFDAKKAGWKSGAAPFGESAEKIVLPDWASNRIAMRTPKTVLDKDVVLIRQSFDLPAMKEGHRYRLRVHGSAHNNMGESYAIYVNGKLLFENRYGVNGWRRQGNSPRGVNIYPEFRELFQGGKVTIAVSSFAMENFEADRFVPPGQALSVWIEEMKLPPVVP